MSIAKTVSKFALGEEPKDAIYWRSRPPEERFAALEEMRRSSQPVKASGISSLEI